MGNDFQQDHKLETYKSMISISVEGFKLLALMNGGAAAGIIAAYDKVSHAVEKGSLKLSILLFVLGLILIGCAPILSYLTQNTLYGESIGRVPENSHIRFIKATFAFFVGSLASFSAGAIVAVIGLK